MTNSVTTERDSVEQERQAAQLKQVQLQNEKLALDLADLKNGKPWYHLPAQLVPLVTALIAIAGFWLGLMRYQDEQQKNRFEQERQSLREEENRQRDFMKPWLDNQRDIYQQALTAAATIANTDKPETRREATEDFWRLYQGKMILVETKTVSDAMVQFGICLDGSVACNRSEMNDRCRILATAMADSMAATAKMTFKEFADNQFKYIPGS
jgi:hypothetical protein